jgi:uncharacterized protein (TIGR02118 family)
MASAPALREHLVSLLRAASHLIIDLSAVEHADANGLAVLVGSRRRARQLGGSLRLAAPSPEVARVLSATGMNQHFEIFPTVRAAISGQPRLPEVIFPSATVPAYGHRIDGVIAGAAAPSAMPVSDRATARAGQGLPADWVAHHPITDTGASATERSDLAARGPFTSVSLVCLVASEPMAISFLYSIPTDPAAFEAAYPEQLALARKLPGLTRLQMSKVWPKEDGSPTPAYRLLDLYFADYAAASAAAAEAGALVGATVEHATGGVVIAFAQILDDA